MKNDIGGYVSHYVGIKDTGQGGTNVEYLVTLSHRVPRIEGVLRDHEWLLNVRPLGDDEVTFHVEVPFAFNGGEDAQQSILDELRRLLNWPDLELIDFDQVVARRQRP